MILSTDASVATITRLGMTPYLRTTLAALAEEFAVRLYSIDTEDHSDLLGVRHVPLGSRGLARGLRQAAYYAALIRHASRMKGLIRVLSSNLPVVPEIRRRSEAFVVVDLHYDWASTTARHDRAPKRWFSHPMQGRCIRGADLVLATTPILARLAEKRYGKRAIVIPNFVDGDVFRPRAHRTERIVYAGRLHWAKGVDALIDAFGFVADRHPHLTLEIFGSGEEEASLQSRVPERISGRVRFRGSRPQAEVAEAIGGARVVALPTLTTEGNPKAAIEALASGTPLVASRVAGIEEMIEDGRTGLLVPPGDAGGLAAAIDRLLGDTDLWNRMSSACLHRARIYAKDRLLRHELRIFRLCVGRAENGR